MPEKAKMNVVYFVVGDKELNSGNGIYVKSLEEMKKSLINIKQASEWRLVISIHGAEDVIATRALNVAWGFQGHPITHKSQHIVI